MFHVTPQQLLAMTNFSEDHDCPLESKGVVGGAITYSFTPTLFGTVIEVSCDCGDDTDVTDYSGW